MHDSGGQFQRLKARIGKLIADARTAADCDQEALAAHIGRDQSYVSKIETGERLPALETALRMGEFVGANPNKLKAMVNAARLVRQFAKDAEVSRGDLLAAIAEIEQPPDLPATGTEGRGN